MVGVCTKLFATLTVLKDAHGSILADTLLRDRRCGLNTNVMDGIMW